ncbi:MAG: hypothetical protein WC242_03330 [Candidatus Paceibacterota bacterium]|jgi:hypothetical protein
MFWWLNGSGLTEIYVSGLSAIIVAMAWYIIAKSQWLVQEETIKGQALIRRLVFWGMFFWTFGGPDIVKIFHLKQVNLHSPELFYVSLIGMSLLASYLAIIHWQKTKIFGMYLVLFMFFMGWATHLIVDSFFH